MPTNHPAKIHIEDIELAIAALNFGECVSIPTETVYGLAADATNGEAVARIFEMKGRPSFNPLICHVDGISMAQEYAAFDPISVQLAEAFWPGPLTLILPLQPQSELHPLVSAGLETVGIRHPKGVAADLITKFGKPLAAPSANKSGKISSTSADHVAQQFSETGLLIMDNGPSAVGLESTIVKVVGEEIFMLRPGAVTQEMIESVTGITPSVKIDGKIEAPGMMTSHYAPDTPIELNCTKCDDKFAWLQFSNVDAYHEGPVLNLSVQGNLVEAAANLYSFLKQLDECGASTICVSPIPFDGLGIAINDRLKRAAAPKDQK